MKSIVLIGMPGAGKSTIGKLLSDKLDLAFVDTDRLIEHEIKQSIQNYLDVNGYLKLRSIEEKVILRENIENKVIATGGSAVYSEQSMNHLGKKAKIIFLNVDQNEIEKRITNFATRGITKRPGQSFSSLFKERQKLYMKYFDYKVDTTHLTIDATLNVVEKIAQS